MAQRVTPAIPSAAQAQSAVNGLPAIVQHWMLRILIDLKGEQYLIGRHGFKDEDVATQLGFRELLTEAQFDDPDIGAVRKHLRSMAILPDNPKAELRATWATENPNAVYDDYKNRLGNLTMLEKPINIVAGNDFYAAKQAEYGKSGNYLTRSLKSLTDVGRNTTITRINDKLEAFSNWNAASIEKRHAMLIGIAQDVWKTTPIDI